ncbi:tagatose-6-phosphate kinase [Ruminiclostridium hungatei]|uniref:Tagatose-6-phosphate kinase n=1 Tax=Ruminiclostridium hungatei TaxID=48256 RepID=A0A1V4SNP8_RUMHU|nr:1-phosphofructokinase family hexose kinase [Ruminiclostridium hungatei]OPX45423.1 tagatose-6-phosphate kinase [Ruminiclostridium hungatei]
MITALSLSPAVDRIYMIDNFTPGSLYRVGNCIQSAGGKGINVSRVLKILEAPVRVLGFKAGSTGQWLEKSLEDLGAETGFIPVEGQSRTNNNIIDKINGLETEILEEGPTIDNEAWEVFLQKFRLCLRDTKVLVCSGGLPRGLGADTYAGLIREAGKAGVKTMLDSSGEVLKQGVEAGPYLIKPNLKELSTYFNRQFGSDGQIVEACREIIKKGVSIVVTSLGEKGALLVSEDKVLKARPLEVKALNTIGSGDSMVAGISKGLAEELPLEECFRLGCACAASNTEFIEIGVINKSRVEQLKQDIAIYEI